jgi:hypothetical protein
MLGGFRGVAPNNWLLPILTDLHNVILSGSSAGMSTESKQFIGSVRTGLSLERMLQHCTEKIGLQITA